MKYKFENSEEVRTSNCEEVGDIADAILKEMFGKDPPCSFQIVCKEKDVYVLKKTFRDVHKYKKKTPMVLKKRKRRWHPTKGRRKYIKYLTK